jgi:4-hydroxy-tetrahydrodipicolinate synthase
MSSAVAPLLGSDIDGPRFGGLITALVTPFREDRLDLDAVTRLVERQLEVGVDGLLIASGHAGEGDSLRPDEFRTLVEHAIRTVQGRAKVVVGASSNATAEAIALCRQAENLGADAAWVTAPWYNRPSQDGLVAHYRAVAEATRLPILVGNEPQRTMIDLSPATMARLADIPGLAGMGDSTGEVARVAALRTACPDWSLLSAHDPSRLGFIASGGDGTISATANVAPRAVQKLAAAAAVNDYSLARHWQGHLARLDALLAADPCPAAAKYALSRLGLCRPDVRLPITPYPQEARPNLDRALGPLLEGFHP